MRKTVKITKGAGGWGTSLQVCETSQQKYVVSVTGGGIHPLAARIAELLGVETKDGFKEKIEPETIIVVVIDCGGTLRCGVYPKLGVKTIDIHPISPSGPLSKFINESNFISGSTVNDVSLVETSEDSEITDSVSVNMNENNDNLPYVSVSNTAADQITNDITGNDSNASEGSQSSAAMHNNAAGSEKKSIIDRVANLGKAIGKIVNIFYQGGRSTLEIVWTNILPFMIFVSIMVGIINYTGIGTIIATAVKPLAGNIFGLIILSIICAIPVLSPVLGPGAVIAQVIGVLIGVEIGKGTIPLACALPALFAINSQVGCDFAPVALTLAESDADTVETGVPAILFSRLITGPIAVIIAWALSIGLY